jgi:hypothetical protein
MKGRMIDTVLEKKDLIFGKLFVNVQFSAYSNSKFKKCVTITPKIIFFSKKKQCSISNLLMPSLKNAPKKLKVKI